MQSDKRIVIQLNDVYLPITENWIYNHLINIKKYNSASISHKIQNLELFPLPNIYSPGPLYNLVNKIHFALFGEHMLYFHEKIIKKHDVILIHAHFGPVGVRNLKLKLKLNIPMITTFYGFDISSTPKDKRWLKKYKKLFENGDLFLAEGTNMKNELVKLGCPAKKIKVQHLGVDLKQIKVVQKKLPLDGRVKILIAASFREKKGIPYAIKAFAKVKQNHPNIQLQILGDGPMRDQIESLIAELDISNSVTLLGYQSHEVFIDKLASNHIFMQPSITAMNGDTEGGAPVSIIEAQAAGMPVISSCHADIPEVVIDGESALLASEKDVDALAKHLEYLVEHPEVWDKMGQAGRKHVENDYDLIIQSEKLEKIYDMFG